MVSNINLKVLILDSDFYALQSLNSYLAWDRRTRVVALAADMVQAFDYIRRVAEPELPDVVLLEPDAFPNVEALRAAIHQFKEAIKDVMVICMARKPDPHYASAAVEAGVRGYMLRSDVRLHLASAIVYALDRDLLVTQSIHSAATPAQARLFHASVLPPEREYPEMTQRIRQAIWLCVVEGMPAQLAADEMGISPHTIRSYIKEGYRILEAHDDTNYPEEMGPLERAFMRFTALNDKDKDEDDTKQP